MSKDPYPGYYEDRAPKVDQYGFQTRPGKRIDSDARKKRWQELKSVTWPRIVEYVVKVAPHGSLWRTNG